MSVVNSNLVTPPLPAVNDTFTVSFAKWADGGPETLLHYMRGFQFLIWHRWNGCIVNTMVVVTSCQDGFVYGIRQSDGGLEEGEWQCAVADLIHLEYQ